MQVPAHEAGSGHAGLRAASQHLLDGVQDAVIDAFAKSNMKRCRTHDIIHGDHDEGLEQSDRDLRSAAGARARVPWEGIRPQYRTRPLAGQSCRYLWLADEAKSQKPFSDPTASGGALRGQGIPQLVDGELLARKQ